MNTRSGIATVSIVVLSMTLHYPLTQMDLSQATTLIPMPADVQVQISASETKEPLQVAGNTACNPRVTVCEE